MNDDFKIEILFKILGIGAFVIIVGIYFFGKLISKEYPKVTSEININGRVSSVQSQRGTCNVIFENDKKFFFPWAQNFNYEAYPDLSDLLSAGDWVVKRKFSDTVLVDHAGIRYIYILEKKIDKK